MTSPAPSRRATAQRIPSLDGLRAVSILLVLVGHDAGLMPGLPAWVVGWLGYGSQVGVDTFFVLSGFLITRLLMEQQRRSGGRLSLGKFYLRRGFRIWPALYVYLGVVAGLVGAGWIAVGRGEWWAAALFVWGYYPGAGAWFLAHTWTLAIEEQFYLLWPACVRWVSERRLAMAAVVIIAVSPGLRVAAYALLPAARGGIAIALPTRLDTLMFGALAALLYDHAGFQRQLQWGFEHGMAAVGTAVLVVNPLLIELLRGSYQLIAGFTAEGAAAAMVMLWAIQHADSAAGRWLNRRPVVHLGLISYSLYLWQQMFLGGAHAVWGCAPGLDIIYALAAAEVSYWAVEQPMLRLRARALTAARAAADRVAIPA